MPNTRKLFDNDTVRQEVLVVLQTLGFVVTNLHQVLAADNPIGGRDTRAVLENTKMLVKGVDSRLESLK